MQLFTNVLIYNVYLFPLDGQTNGFCWTKEEILWKQKKCEAEKVEFKAKERERSKKAMQAKHLRERKYDSTRTSWL